MEKEIWRDIPEYEGLYQISNYGRVRSLDTIINCKGAKNIDKHIRYGKILKQSKNPKGYYYVNLSKDGKVKNTRVHRLVALCFVNNPNNLKLINHIDGNKLNNYYINLEWCDYSHNIKEAYRIGLREKPKYFGINYKLKKE